MQNIKTILLTTMMIMPALASDPDLEAAIAASLELENACQQEEDAFNARVHEAIRRSQEEEYAFNARIQEAVRRSQEEELQRVALETQKLAAEERRAKAARLAQNARAIVSARKPNTAKIAALIKQTIKETRARSLMILNLQVTQPLKAK